jgi:hypothetical protein
VSARRGRCESVRAELGLLASRSVCRRCFPSTCPPPAPALAPADVRIQTRVHSSLRLPTYYLAMRGREEIEIRHTELPKRVGSNCAASACGATHSDLTRCTVAAGCMTAIGVARASPGVSAIGHGRGLTDTAAGCQYAPVFLPTPRIVVLEVSIRCNWNIEVVLAAGPLRDREECPPVLTKTWAE